MAPGEHIRRDPAAHAPPLTLSGDASGMNYATLHACGLAGLPLDLSPRLFDDGVDSVSHAFSGDDFLMYEFKVRRCPRGRSHDWTDCPYAHPGEKARRRDPRRFHYSGTPCPSFRIGGGRCRRGDGCEYAHGVFETWLHPARYRTQPCKDGAACLRRVCFFAHSPEQLRVVLPSSPRSPGKCGGAVMPASPTSTLAAATMYSPSYGSSSPSSPVAVEDVVAVMSKLRLSEMRSSMPFGTRTVEAGFLATACVPPLSPASRTTEDKKATTNWSLKEAKLLAGRRNEEDEEEAARDLEWVSELVKD
ncbi:zinc finger CCCH domain-containing protein 2-like [Zingiber officinale]|uniref:C3H1-type domain-containing protein n=1 Tax=Zingiber officinale TaxID=94328 RepID=A0A8J5KN12_ZINOF|nr:zinc finger CCCH domain-containing protein 2-like [Zingiber officinale]KAG6490231.1 hypothetical protein ZIOFF_051516 [Zingiber officinale]